MTGENSIEYETVIATVDAVVMTIEDEQLKVLLHRRPREPFAGLWALPGGFIHPEEDEDGDAAIKRILRDKAGVDGIYFEQLRTWSGKARDPRGWSLSISHLALVPHHRLEISGDPDVALVDVTSMPPLAFDHEEIIAAAHERLRGKGMYSTLPASFLEKSFTLAQLRSAYETILGHEIDRTSFNRKIESSGLLVNTGKTSTVASRRPAMLYRLKGGVQTTDRMLGSLKD